jgi:hypothetical protein
MRREIRTRGLENQRRGSSGLTPEQERDAQRALVEKFLDRVQAQIEDKCPQERREVLLAWAKDELELAVVGLDPTSEDAEVELTNVLAEIIERTEPHGRPLS